MKKQDQPDGRAFSLAVSPDGQTLAAGCTDSSVHLLDARTGEKRFDLRGVPRGCVRTLGFTPDGKTIAGVCDDNRLRLWDGTTGELMKALPALSDTQSTGLPQRSADSLAISPDGGLIAVGGGGTTQRGGTLLGDETSFFEIRVLDVKTGALAWSHLGRRGYIQQLAFSPDGTMFASTTSFEVRLWDARAGDLKQTLKPRSGGVWSLAFSPERAGSRQMHQEVDFATAGIRPADHGNYWQSEIYRE